MFGNLSAIHGAMQAIAFLVLFPIGGLIALLRRNIGPGWVKYHVFFQLLATFTVFAAGGVQLYKWYLRSLERKDEATKTTRKLSKKLLTHIILGSVVSVLLLIQIIWAYFGRRFVEWTIWYNIHIALASLILSGGIANLWLGWSFH